MDTMRLDLATVLRRAQSTALIALSCATIAFPAIARADDGSDKGSSARSSSKGGSTSDAKDERTPSDDDAQARALDEALLPSFDMISVTGGPTGASLKSLDANPSYRGRAGALGLLASGAVLATQFRSFDNMSVTSSALTSPAAGMPELGNPNAPIVNPEPGTVALLAAGLGVLSFAGYRRRKGNAQP